MIYFCVGELAVVSLITNSIDNALSQTGINWEITLFALGPDHKNNFFWLRNIGANFG
jgi:hypothetical protein